MEKMYKVILDPNLFECDKKTTTEYQFMHFQYLKNNISFLYDYCCVTLDFYQGAPYWFSGNPYLKPPITESHYIKTYFFSEIMKKIQRIINKNNSEKDISKTNGSLNIFGLDFIESSVCKGSFLRYLETQLDVLDNCIFVLGMEGESCPVTAEFNGKTSDIQAISNLPSDCSNQVVKILNAPDDDNCFFPSKDACKTLNDSFKDEIANKNLTNAEKISIRRKYGCEFASRNYYSKDKKLTKSNPTYSVFLHNKNRYAISVDQEHGGIEVFKKKNTTKKYNGGKTSSFMHIGEYSYSGKQTKDAEPDHHILYD